MSGQKGTVVQKGASYFIKYRDRNGKQKMQGSAPGRGFRTEKEAIDRLHEVLNDINKGTYVEPRSITFAVFADQWLRNRISIRGSTDSAYGSIIRQHLVPCLGTLNVQAIQHETVAGLVSELTADLSVKTLHNAITLLRGMLVGKKGPSAIKLGYIRHDPTNGVELPPLHHNNVSPPTSEQVWILIDRAEEMAKCSPLAQIGHAAIFVDAFTGLRRGEILALQYSDIDWFAREIIVSRSISLVKAADGVHKWQWKVGPTKNGRTRRVGVGERVLRFLAELKQAAMCREGYLFTPEMVGLAGNRYSFIAPDYFDASIYGPIAVVAGLSQTRFHDLRHFFASKLIAQGETAKYVCDQMGHSSIQITFDTYGHLFPQARKEASTKFEDQMFAQRGLASVENAVERRSEAVDKERAN